jgi:hypothetical protein
MKFFVVPAAALVMAASLLQATPVPADAQTATNLKCKGCVGKKDIGTKAVMSKSIRPGAILRTHIQDKAIDASKLADGAVDASKLADDAKPAAAVNTHSTGSVVFSNSTGVALLSDTVVLDSPGALHVIASWTWWLDPGDRSTCTVTLDSAGFTTANSIFSLRNAALSEPGYYAGTTSAVFPASAGSRTVRLICKSDNATNVGVVRPNLTILYVPGLL